MAKNKPLRPDQHAALAKFNAKLLELLQSLSDEDLRSRIPGSVALIELHAEGLYGHLWILLDEDLMLDRARLQKLKERQRAAEAAS